MRCRRGFIRIRPTVNGGGWIADYIVDWLARPRLMMAMTREGQDNVIPHTVFGPKVMLINEMAGSGGDVLPGCSGARRSGRW